MSGADVDFIVVGGGSNSLTAAAYLAASGHSVHVLERNEYIGGGCISRELTLPGFKHDQHATNAFLVKANPLIRFDELGLLSRFGLKYVQTDDPYHGSLFADGAVIRTFTDLERSCADLARTAPQDVAAYRDFVTRAMKVVELITWGMFVPPADPAVFLELLGQSEDGRYLLGLLEASAWDLIQQHFQSEHLRTHLLRMTAEMMVSPNAPGTAFAMYLILGLSHRYTSGFVQGGSQEFSNSLARCLEHHGGRISVSTNVTRLLKEGDRIAGVQTADGQEHRARRAVVACIPPWLLHRYLEDFPAELTAAANRAKPSDYGVFLSSYALNKPVVPRYPVDAQRIQINQMCSPKVDDVQRMVEECRTGRLPSVYYGNFICATLHDPSRAPAGQHTLYLYHMVPMVPAGQTVEAWDGLRDGFAQWLLDGARQYLDGLEDDNILGAHHDSPFEMSHHTDSFRNGDVMGLGTFAEQFLGGRPSAEFAQYRVPGYAGLYLCGPFMHPGGGVCGGGRAVAMRALHDLGLDLDRAFRY